MAHSLYPIIISLFISCVEAPAASFVDGAILIQFTAYRLLANTTEGYPYLETRKVLELRVEVCSRSY